MSDVEAIRAEAERREISRLVHFTPTRNLVHIVTGSGLKSTKMMSEEERAEFNQQDLRRLDGHPDHICCTIEYPNAFYYRSKRASARGEEALFPNWVALLVSAKHLWSESTLLCPHNAAGRGGINVTRGLECFMSMFAEEVDAPRATRRRRGQPDCCPTDVQAEVLIQRQVPLGDVLGIVVESAEQAADTDVLLRQLEAPRDSLPLVVCPEFFDPLSLVEALESERRPVEQTWHPAVDADSGAAEG